MLDLHRWLIPGLLICLLLGIGESFARGGISLDEAVEDARNRTGGRVISAETQEQDGRQVYNIRVLTKDGRVKRLRIDSESGRRDKGRRSR